MRNWYSTTLDYTLNVGTCVCVCVCEESVDMPVYNVLHHTMSTDVYENIVVTWAWVALYCSECVLLKWNVIHALNLMSHLTDLPAILAAARLISIYMCMCAQLYYNEWMSEWMIWVYCICCISRRSQAVAIIRLSAVRYVEWRQTE